MGRGVRKGLKGVHEVGGWAGENLGGVGEFVGVEWGNLWGWSGERSSEGREIPEWEGKHGESNDGQVEVEKREREER